MCPRQRIKSPSLSHHQRNHLRPHSLNQSIDQHGSMVVLTANHFVYAGSAILDRAKRDGGDRDFRALFGVGANLCSVVWNLCDFPDGTKPKHLLWALLFLKVYASESALISIAGGPTRKAFRKWVGNRH